MLDSVSGVYPLLLTSPGMPRLSSYLFSSPNNLLFDIPRCVRVQKGADAECTRSTLTGPAVDVFVLGVKEGEEGEEVQSAHANVLSFQCVDETGEPLRWIVREDVEVAVQYGALCQVAFLVVVPDGGYFLLKTLLSNCFVMLVIRACLHWPMLFILLAGTGDETEANVLLPSCTPHVELSGHVATVSMIITNQRTEWVTISISLPGASPIYLRPKVRKHIE